MKRIESGDKLTKWKPRNKQAGLLMRKARQEFEPLPEVTPRIVRPDPAECQARAKGTLAKVAPIGKPPRLQPKNRKHKFKGNANPPRL